MDKTTLLNTIQTERLHFESLIAPLSETQLCTATLEGQWSIKDILAHIAAWEQLCTGWLEEFLRGKIPHPEDILNEPQNDRIYLENRDHPLQAGQTTALSQSQAISGLGGIGKTQLAVEYAYRYASEY